MKGQLDGTTPLEKLAHMGRNALQTLPGLCHELKREEERGSTAGLQPHAESGLPCLQLTALQAFAF